MKTFTFSMNPELLKIKGYFDVFIIILKEIIIDVWLKLLSFFKWPLQY